MEEQSVPTQRVKTLELKDLKIGSVLIDSKTKVEHYVADIKTVSSCITNKKNIITIMFNFFSNVDVINCESLVSTAPFNIDTTAEKLDAMDKSITEVTQVSNLKIGSVIVPAGNTDLKVLLIDSFTIIELINGVTLENVGDAPSNTNLQFKTLTENQVTTQFSIKEVQEVSPTSQSSVVKTGLEKLSLSGSVTDDEEKRVRGMD